MGECVLIIEDQERHLRAWDFVHCPPMTAHTFVAKETGPCVILATGNRRDDHERVYRRSEVALRYGAGTEVDTTGPEGRGRWEVQRPKHWDELPWAERPKPGWVRCGVRTGCRSALDHDRPTPSSARVCANVSWAVLGPLPANA
jgi:hypothetical protein